MQIVDRWRALKEVKSSVGALRSYYYSHLFPPISPYYILHWLWSLFQIYDVLTALPNGSRPGGLFPVPGQVLLRGRSTIVRPARSPKLGLMLTDYRSWKRAFLYTNDLGGLADHGGNVSAFLSHPESVELLSQSLIPFARPSAKSKSEFESKTAAVNVETNSKSSFDLQEIKADAQWLSEKAQLDEITALRITVLEWQNRPATRLTSTFSTEEATSLQSATGTDNLRVSVAGPNLANVLRQTAGEEGSSSFTTESNRRLRLRNLYLSERSHVLKTFRKLLAFSLHDLSGESARFSGNESDRRLALCKLGVAIFQEKSAGDGLSRLLEDCITGIRKRLKDLEGDGGWLGVIEGNQETEDIWRTTMVEEIVHILQIMFHQLQASSEIPSGDLLVSWLELMLDYNFLMTLQVVGYGCYILGSPY